MAGVNGVSAYQQTNKTWNNYSNKSAEVDKKTDKVENKKTEDNVKVSEWKPVTNNSLIPTQKEGIGMAIGDVQLSDKAKDYYSKLKAKFGNMEFIAVSADMKERVKANAAAYGNANKMVVLIDDAKLEQMANDESFRKKYEGIIAMSQSKMDSARSSLASTGAKIKNFGISVNSDGSTSFFATLEKSSAEQTKRLEKKQAEKKAAKAKEKKQTEKKDAEKRLEKAKEKKKADEARLEDDEDKEYIKLESDSIEDLINKVSKYAYNNSENNVVTESEKNIGQLFDFKG